MKTPGLIAAAEQQRTLTAVVPQGATVARAAALSGDVMSRGEHTDRAALIAERDALASTLAATRIENEQLTSLVFRMAALLEAIDNETPEPNVTGEPSRFTILMCSHFLASVWPVVAMR